MRGAHSAAERAVRQAAKAVMGLYGRAQGVQKADKSIVTEADTRSEALIKKALFSAFPGYSFIGEESGRDMRASDYAWVVDPLDGTTNFAMQNPFFCISVALAKKGVPVLGIVYYPVMDEMYSAEKGKGAYLNKARIRVSGVGSMEQAFVMFCHGKKREHIEESLGFYSELKRENKKIRQLGAAALELCYLAAGRAEAFIMPGANPWDVAAGELIVQEAGGAVTDMLGNRYDINSEGIVASNGVLHREILQIAAKH